MAVSTITVSRGSGEYDEWTHSPSNWKDGIYDSGSIAISSQNPSYTGKFIGLYDSGGNFLVHYYFPNGKTTALSTAFPGYTLVGKYLEFTENYNSVFVPIVASPSRCGAPSYVTVSPANTTPGSTSRLSWSGATAGSNNSIKGYDIYRATSASGSYTKLTSVTTSSTSGSVNVTAPSSLGSKYFYKVVTVSNLGSSYSSAMSTAYATLTAVNPTACGAPTACAVDSTLSLVATTLRWSGATSGVSNSISRYEVQRRSRTHKGEWSAWSAFQTTSGTSLSVSPPATAGHYYQYRVRAQGTAGESYYSGWKESTNTLRKAHQTVPEFTDPTLIVGLTDVKAVHITELQEALNNILLPFMDENKISFIAIDKNSDAKHWGDHVQELKTAIDSTGVSHDSWVVMQDEVTADVIDQIRRIVRTM